MDKVELLHDQANIEATVFWKVGFRQRVRIKRPSAHFTKENRWRPEEDKLLAMLWPSSSRDAIAAAFPARAWAAINQRASRLKLKRQWSRTTFETGQLWTEEQEAQLSELYHNGDSTSEIARKLGRTERAVLTRASLLGIHRPKGFYPRKVEPTWKAESINIMQESTSRSEP